MLSGAFGHQLFIIWNKISVREATSACAWGNRGPFYYWLMYYSSLLVHLHVHGETPIVQGSYDYISGRSTKQPGAEPIGQYRAMRSTESAKYAGMQFFVPL